MRYYDSEFLTRLRYGLEEVIAILERTPADPHQESYSPAGLSPDPNQVDTKSQEPGPEIYLRDEQYDAALAIVTDFGKANVSLLQMWLSINQVRARRLLEQLEADGLITGSGRVLRKAYVARSAQPHSGALQKVFIP